ncbi:MAG: type II secretion system F family protein [Candidatus Gygaella obscura]|nr:type II secretion system F family protein [Candidatus Gygaella obscura]
MIVLIFLLLLISVILIVNEFIPISYILFRSWHSKKTEETTQSLDRMFYRVSQKKIMILLVSAPLVLGFLGFVFSSQPIGLIIGVIVGAILPTIIMKQLERRRITVFENQLVDGMMIISSSLKAGLSLLQAIESLVEEMPVPISQEFGLLVNENRMGITFEECAQHLKRRVHSEDLDMVITAILVARETGGDLTETFSQLVYTIREKKKLDRRVRTLTVQGRMQGVIMALLPIVFAIFVYNINPNSFDIMLKDDVGRMLLGYAFVSQIIGMILIKKLSQVDF